MAQNICGSKEKEDSAISADSSLEINKFCVYLRLPARYYHPCLEKVVIRQCPKATNTQFKPAASRPRASLAFVAVTLVQSVVTCGGVSWRQVGGMPIGGIFSSVLAAIVLGLDEPKWERKWHNTHTPPLIDLVRKPCHLHFARQPLSINVKKHTRHYAMKIICC